MLLVPDAFSFTVMLHEVLDEIFVSCLDKVIQHVHQKATQHYRSHFDYIDLAKVHSFIIYLYILSKDFSNQAFELKGKHV